MILIRREDPRPTLQHIDLQDAHTDVWPGVCREISPGDLQEVTREGLPVDVEMQVVREIDAEVDFGGDAEESVFEFRLVHIHRDFRAAEVLETAGVV